MLSIHQDFVSPKPEERQQAIDHTKKCIALAAQLGIPAIRLNSGRWNTIKSFDDLMKVKGNEPPMQGYTDEDAFKWCIDCINACLPDAEANGVVLALENHWGLTTKVENLLRLVKGVNSPWLGINLDTGNWPDDPYEGIEKLAPHAIIVQAKTYYGGGVWYTLDLDYPRIAKILKGAGFRGWISLEMEGKEPPGRRGAKEPGGVASCVCIAARVSVTATTSNQELTTSNQLVTYSSLRPGSPSPPSPPRSSWSAGAREGL